MPIFVTITPGCWSLDLCVRSGREARLASSRCPRHTCAATYLPSHMWMSPCARVVGAWQWRGCTCERRACGYVQGTRVSTCLHARGWPCSRRWLLRPAQLQTRKEEAGRRPRSPGGGQAQVGGCGQAGALPVQPRWQLRRGARPPWEGAAGTVHRIPPQRLLRRLPDLWPRCSSLSLRAAFQGQAPAWLTVPLRLSERNLCFPESPGSHWACSPSSRCPEEQSGTPRGARFAWDSQMAPGRVQLALRSPAPSSGDL